MFLKRKLASFVSSLAVAAVLVGCGSTATPPAASSSATVQASSTQSATPQAQAPAQTPAASSGSAAAAKPAPQQQTATTTPAPAISPAPVPAPKEQPAPTTAPKADPAPQPQGVEIVSVTSPAARNSHATLTAHVTPNATAEITVRYKSGPSKAAGLEPKQADGNGNVSWTWKVGGNTTIGTWPITVTCNGQSNETTFEVVH